ncbi:MAG: phage holin family protein [Chloroflexaceae bacterium]|nr:phage holin family protein [Chloroflexaceae bacterium]
MTNQPTSSPSLFDPRRMILRWLISTLAMFAAEWIVPGIRFIGPGWQMGIVALIFGLFKVLLRPILILITLPLVLITLGLFSIVINAVLLGFTSAIAGYLGIEFIVDGFWAALLGSIVISFITMILSALAGDDRIQIRVYRGEKPDEQ